MPCASYQWIRFDHGTVREANRSGALHLTPPAAPVLPNQPPYISNAAARSDGFGVMDVSDDLELHR
jgi:hypothetical protein